MLYRRWGRGPEEEQVVAEGSEGTDVGEERRDGAAVLESGGQMNACVIFDERSICGHTHSCWCVCPLTQHMCLCCCLEVV